MSHPDVTRQHWSANVRKLVLSANSRELVGLGTLYPQSALFLEAAIVARLKSSSRRDAGRQDDVAQVLCIGKSRQGS